MPVIQKTSTYDVKKNITISIEGINRSSNIDFSFLDIRDSLYSGIGSCHFSYRKYGSRSYVPVGGDKVEIWDGSTKIFGGEIINFKTKIEGKTLVYEVECEDWKVLLNGKLVSETYESKTVDQIISDLQGKYATEFDISNVNCPTTIEAIYFEMVSMSNCLDELAKRAGYRWYVDPDKKIYFFAEGSITAPFDITDDNGNCISDSLTIEDDYEQIKNRVNVASGHITTVQVSDATSIATYGEREVIERDDSITSTAEATQKANAILAAYKDPIKKGSFETYEAGLFSGQKINVNSTLRGINQDFMIDSVSFIPRTPLNFVYKVDLITQQDRGLLDFLVKEATKPTPVTEDSFGNEGFTCTVKFSIVNYHKISWDAGDVIMSNGDTYNISASDHEFTNTEICYFCPSISTTELQFSTTFADGIGEDRVALGYAVPNPNTSKGAQFIPVGFMGGVQFWGGENIVARTIIADQIGLNALTSDLVTTGEFITLSAQIKDAVIKNAHIGETLTIGSTEAKCTDPNADQTSANAQPYTWLSGSKPPIDADKTSSNPQSISWLTDSGSFGNMAWEDVVEKAKLGTTVISGGYIKSDLLTASNIVTGTLNASYVNVTNLDADKITTGTLTGRTVQTGTSSQSRVEMRRTGDSTAPNKLRWVSSSGTNLGSIYQSAWTAGSDLIIDAGSNDRILLKAGGTTLLGVHESGAAESADLYPFGDDYYSLGGTDTRWKYLYLSNNLYTDGNIVLQDGGDINPDSDVSDLGQSFDYFHQLYANLVRYKTIGAFQSHDDIQLMKNIKMKEDFIAQPHLARTSSGKKGKGLEKKVKGEVWDEKTMPDGVYEDGFYDAGKVNGFLIGTVKQLIERVEELEK